MIFKKRLLIIDDEPLIPNLLKEIIEADQDLEIAGVATRKTEFLAMIWKEAFDALLIDLSIEEREGGLKLLSALQKEKIVIPSIVFSAHDEQDYALKCLKFGAKGYISKNSLVPDLIRGVKEVLNGNLFVSGESGKYILDQYKQHHAKIYYNPPPSSF